MFATLLVAAAAAPAAPVPADATPAPAGPAPWVVRFPADDTQPPRLVVQTRRTVKQTVAVQEIVNGQPVPKQVVRDVQTVAATTLALADLPGTVTAADGSPVGAAELVRRVRTGVTVLISADGKAVDRAWLRAVGPGTVVVVSEAFAGAVAPPQVVLNTPAATTPAPRLTLLATGPDGTVRVTTHAGAGAAVMRPQVVFLNNGNQVMPVMTETGPAATGPRTRPLDEVPFDAYDLAGRAVPREDAVRRLRAGGLVLAAADNRLPDAAFLQPFRGDLLVLVSAEGLGVPPGGPRPVNVRPLPAAAPAMPVPAVPAPAVVPAAPVLRVAPLRAAPAAPAVPPQP